MQFTLEFYESSTGARPVEVFLEDLARTDPADHAALLSGLVRLRDSQNHRLPLCRSLGRGIFELRHLGKLNSRVLWFFMAGQRIVAVHGLRHKAQTIPAQELQTARDRQKDWQRRHA